MNDHSLHDHTRHVDPPSRTQPDSEVWKRRGRWVFWAFAVIAAAYLIAEHRAHLSGALPFLILLACPLLHMFMHGGHGGHGDAGGGSERHVHANPEERRNA